MSSGCWKRASVNSNATLVAGEFLITNQDGVRLEIDKERKEFGDLALSSHRLIWSKAGCDHDLNLALSAVLMVEHEEGGLMSSEKVSLTCIDQTVCKLAFKQGGCKPFMKKMHDALALRQWEVKVIVRTFSLHIYKLWFVVVFQGNSP